MEAAAKSIKSLVSSLPDRPHHLAVSPDARYQQHPNDTRLEEDAIRPLQYMTFLFDVDRGLLLTRAYSDIRKEESHAPRAPQPPADPSKPKTKFSLKDYKNRKQETTTTTNTPDRPSPRKSHVPPAAPTPPSKPTPPVKDQAPAIKKENLSPAADIMLRKTLNKAHPSLPPRPDVRRPGTSPSPDRKKRPSDANEERAMKRPKVEGAAPSSLSRVSSRSDTPSKSADRPISHERKPSRDLKPPPPLTNGRSSLNNSAGSHGASPRSGSQVNGYQKHSISREEKEDTIRIPPLLSPLGASGSSSKSDFKPSPTKKPAEKAPKPPPLKKPRDESEPTSTPKKSRAEIPPLLSPTLPPIVREAQQLHDKKLNLGKDSSQRSSAQPDSPGSAKKAPMKPPKDSGTIHVESKQRREEPPSMIVKLKYPKRIAKTVSRLLALAPRKKTETVKREGSEVPRKDERSARERSDSLEPTYTVTARKRPRTSTDVSEPPTATKRPKTTEAPQPLTPSKHATTMQRVASSSSQAGTPGATNSLTPAAPIMDRRSTSVDPERVNRLRKQHTDLVNLGTRLKHKRDRIMKPKEGSKSSAYPTAQERNSAMAASIQSAVAYMAGFKALDDSRDAERKQQDAVNWRSLMPLMRVYRQDCNQSAQLLALFVRLYAIYLVWYSKALVSMGPSNANTARELFQNMKDQDQFWKHAYEARRRLDDNATAENNGPVGRLLDRLGPWSQAEDVVGITISILKKAIRLDDDKFAPESDLLQAAESMANGS
jgi:hypothetical protein